MLPTSDRFDLLIYGATSAGVAAAVQAKRLGLNVALVGADPVAGGMSVCGLGWTDYGHKEAVGGLAREFHDALGRHYGLKGPCWGFEPSAAQLVFAQWLDDAGVEPLLQARLASVTTKNSKLDSITLEEGQTLAAHYFLDATYEGDLLAAAGVSFRCGRESIEEYNEIFNGRHFGHPNHNFVTFVDPYRVPGQPSSGLLPGISDEAPGVQGEGDNCIQAYNFRLCLTQDPAIKVPFPKPENDDPARYELLLRYINTTAWDVLRLSFPVGRGNKTDTNNCGAFSFDHIGANHDWPEADWTRREEIFHDHLKYTKGLLWFLSHDRRLPNYVRDEVNTWGLPADEFTDSEHFPPELYIREGRRLFGEYVLTEHNCVGALHPEDGVALASYAIDSHHCRRLVVGGRVYNEGNVEMRLQHPYSIPYRCMTPKRTEARNLLVCCAVSASHTAFGSLRMEPVFMEMAQAASNAVALALPTGQDVQDINVPRLQERLEEQNQPYRWLINPNTP